MTGASRIAGKLLRTALLLVLGMAAQGCGAAPDLVANEGDAAPAPPTASIGEVDYSCKVDADCAVKNVGNCCGYYPACVNKDSPTFPEQVQARCAAEGVSSVCGFPEISGCACVEGRCTNLTGPTGRLIEDR